MKNPISSIKLKWLLGTNLSLVMVLGMCLLATLRKTEAAYVTARARLSRDPPQKLNKNGIAGARFQTRAAFLSGSNPIYITKRVKPEG